MSFQVQLLTQLYHSEKKIASAIEASAKKLGLKFRSESAEDFSVSVPDFGDLLEISINTENEYKKTQKEDFFIRGHIFGANIIIGYAFGREDKTLIAFLREFLTYFPDMILYANENIPGGAEFYAYLQEDINKFTTTDQDVFYDHPSTRFK